MYKIFIGILFINLSILKIHAANPSNCLIDSVDINWDTAYYQNKQIDDTDVDAVVATWTFTSNLTNVTYDDSKYLDITINDKQLTFKTNDEFKNFDKDHIDTKNVISFSFNIYLKCENDQQSSLTFEQPVRDTNNHDPKFLKDAYSYQIPMPILPNYMITNFGDSIIAEDLDFSNTDITFTITPNDNFAIQTQSSGDKQYEAKITVTQPMKYNQTTQFTLTATDNGVRARSAVTTLTIQVDEDNSLPDPPKFTRTNYNFDYTINDDGQAVLTATNGDIVITTESSDDLTFDLTPKLDGLEYSFDKTTKIVTITLNSPLSDLTQHTIVLTLTVSDSVDTTSATILINIPDDLVEVKPKFSSPYYRATYTVNDDGTDTVKVDATISITPSSGVNVEVIGDYKDNFAISNNDNQWTLTVSKDLDNTILEEGGDIVVQIQATISGNDAKEVGLIIVELPQSETVIPKFSSPYYRATYTVNDDGTDTVKVDGTISITPSSGVNVEVIGDYKDNFAISNGDNQWTLTVSKDLDNTILEKGGDIVVQIQATISGNDAAEVALIVMELPQTETVIPKFSSPYYRATYTVNDDGTDTVKVDGTISITPSSGVNVEVIGDYKDNFAISNGDNQWTLTVSKDLDNTILEKGGDIVVQIQATISGNDAAEVALIVMELPQTETVIPKFSSPYYRATYTVNDDGTDTVKVDGTISITPSSGVNVEVIGDYKDNFAISNGDNQWTLTVSKDLDNTILEKGGDIVIQIQATISGNDAKEVGLIVMELPQTETVIPKFSSPYYSATYTVSDDGNGKLKVDSTISITPSSGVNVEVIGDYANYFDISCTDQCVLKLKQNLPETVLDEDTETILTISATISSQSTQATIIIDLPLKQTINPIKFSKSIYIGDYTKSDDGNDSVQLENGPISVIDGTTSDTIVTTDDDYFKIEIDDDHWVIIVNVNLPETILQQSTYILGLQLTKNTITNSCKVVIKLPKQVVTSPIEFTKILYTGDYQPDTQKLQIETIQLTGQQLDQVTIALTGEFSKYFTNNYNKTNGIITLSTSEITEDIIDANSAISINIEATLDTVVVASGVIITFPKVSTNQITFNDVLYISKYDDTTNSLETDQTIIVQTTHLDMVEISLKGDSAQYFKYSYDKETGEISVDNVAIPSSVVDENSAISFEIFAKLIENNQQQANCSVGFVVTLSKNIVKSDSVDFNKALYVGEYKTDNSDHPTIVLNETIKMSLIDSTGSISDVQVTAIGEESDYFTIKNNNGQIEISCKKLPDQVLVEQTVITLTLKAILTTDTEIVGEAGFVVQLPASNNSGGGGGGGDNGDDCDCNDTAYIVVIVILAILLIAGLLGSGTFYYLRRRRGSSYKNMDKISGAANNENRYVKNANLSENKKFEPPPVRRPTGLAHFPAYDENDNKIVDNDDDEPSRRKSVIFDDTIEELQIEAKNNEINDEPTTEI